MSYEIMYNREGMDIKIKKQDIILLLFFVTLFIIKFTPFGEPGFKRYSEIYGMLDMKFFYNIQDVKNLIQVLATDGTRFYMRLLIIDMIFITSFMFVQARIMIYILRKMNVSGWGFKLYYLAFIRGIFDYIENTLLFTYLYAYKDEYYGLIHIASLFTSLKWIVLVLAMVMISLVVIRVKIKDARQRRSDENGKGQNL